MKLYHYLEFRKLNQALDSFKKNEVPIIKVDVLIVGDKVQYFVLTDPKYEPKPKEEVKKDEREKKTIKSVKPSKLPKKKEKKSKK